MMTGSKDTRKWAMIKRANVPDEILLYISIYSGSVASTGKD
jgi:hypothetical protein